MGLVSSVAHGTAFVVAFATKSLNNVLTFLFQILTEWPNPGVHIFIILTLLLLSKFEFNHFFVLTLVYALVFCDLLYFYWLLAYLVYCLASGSGGSKKKKD